MAQYAQATSDHVSALEASISGQLQVSVHQNDDAAQQCAVHCPVADGKGNGFHVTRGVALPQAIAANATHYGLPARPVWPRMSEFSAPELGRHARSTRHRWPRMADFLHGAMDMSGEQPQSVQSTSQKSGIALRFSERLRGQRVNQAC